MIVDLKSLKDAHCVHWPPNAGEQLLAVLRDEGADTADRVIAAELAADPAVIDEHLVEALLSILDDADLPDRLRAKAALSLGPILEGATLGLDELRISERTLARIQGSLQKLYMDAGAPKEVRRLGLEASVRAPQGWHEGAVRAAYGCGDEDWRLSAVFSMRWVRGFNDQILEALGDGNEQIRYQAVCAAGEWEIEAGWPHIVALLEREDLDKALLLAAIDAVASIRPGEAEKVLTRFVSSVDEDVAIAAIEATAMAEALSGEAFPDDL